MAESSVPPRNRKGLRTGFTTGACAAAAAKAAARYLVRNTVPTEIETTLPNRMTVTFPLKRCERTSAGAICSVIKDAGDDPDCTHGAELVAEVALRSEPGVEIRGGPGVAIVTKPGLGLEVGTASITSPPRRNITEMVEQEIVASPYGGASVIQGIDVARERGLSELVLTTGGKSEAFAMKLLPHLPEDAFIQMGDFVGTALKHCARRNIRRAVIVGMIGKLSKMADGRMQTHAAGSEVNMELLAALARESGGSKRLCAEIRQANTARHVLELCTAENIALASLVCGRVVQHGKRYAGGPLEVHAYLVDFSGNLLGEYPADAIQTEQRR